MTSGYGGGYYGGYSGGYFDVGEIPLSVSPRFADVYVDGYYEDAWTTMTACSRR